MSADDGVLPKQRNRNYEETHLLLIEKTAELITGSGAEGVSISALARVTGINRSTIYYHFETREDLMFAAKERLGKHPDKGVDAEVSRWIGIDTLSTLFEQNPQVIASWIDECIAVGEIRKAFPQWDRLVAQIEEAFAELLSDEPCDADVYSALVLSSALIYYSSCSCSSSKQQRLQPIGKSGRMRRARLCAMEWIGLTPVLTVMIINPARRILMEKLPAGRLPLKNNKPKAPDLRDAVEGVG